MSTENRTQYVQNGTHKIEWVVENGVHTVKIIKDVQVAEQLVLNQEELTSWTYTEPSE